MSALMKGLLTLFYAPTVHVIIRRLYVYTVGNYLYLNEDIHRLRKIDALRKQDNCFPGSPDQKYHKTD